MNEVGVANHARSLSEIVSEIREEAKQFLNTRLEMLKSEVREIAAGFRVAVPLALVALVFIGTAFLLFSGAIVALVASAFAGNQYAWFFALGIVAFLWVLFGGVAGFFAYNELRSKAVFPKRTAEVLKADKNWLQAEAKVTYDRAA